MMVNRLVGVFCGVLLVATLARAEEWRPKPATLPPKPAHPLFAATPGEIARLRAAYASTGSQHKVVAPVVTATDAAMTKPIVYPPRGGQHNQWYQCEPCQMGLKTVDDTHHHCPRCRKVYSGPPYDDVVFIRKHSANLRAMRNAAWAYAITEKRSYAEFAAKILLGYAQRYRQYPYHDARCNEGKKASKSGGHLFEQTLTEASAFVGTIAPAYDLIHDSGVLTPDDHRAIREGLILPMVQNIGKYQAGKSNWQSWHNAALLMGGALLHDATWINKAVADPQNGFAYQMTVSVMPEGMWYENSWGYHFYTLSALVELAESARRLNIDLWSHPALKKMFTLPARYAMADGSLPRFGDDVKTSAKGNADNNEAAYHAYHDPAIAALLPTKPTWESILLGRKPSATAQAGFHGSEVFPGAGHAILRTAGPAGLTAALTFGPYGGGHGHFDKLSFVLFGHGTELGVDAGRAASQAYRLPIHRDWYKATLGHNAVLVDGASQAPATGQLESFAANENCAAAVARCDAAYPGTTHRRILCLTSTCAIVVDELSSDRFRRFDWLYHNRGDAARSTPPTQSSDAAALPFPGHVYLQNVASVTTGEPVRIAFPSKKVATHLTLAASPNTQIHTADGPAASVLDRVPMAIVTRSGRSALFAAVIEPTQAEPTVTAIAADRSSSGLRITLKDPAATTLTLGSNGILTVTANGKVVLTAKPDKK